MKYSFQIEEHDVGGTIEMYFRLQDGLEPLSRFINHDISRESWEKVFKVRIMSVVNGEIPIETIGGNLTVITIKSDFIDVEDTFFQRKVTNIETSELISLVEVYLKEKEKFNTRL